jgi:hypothetical protein
VAGDSFGTKNRSSSETGWLYRGRTKWQSFLPVAPEKKIMTCVPMHRGDLKRSLVPAVLQQAGLTEDEFRELI